MIIKDYGLVSATETEEKFIFNHAQDIDVARAEIKRLQECGGDGYNQSRTQRHVGRIPAIEFLRHPEWTHEPSLILKWLQSDEGKQYQIHKIRSGRSAQCIVK
jgi:hypothetical protein